MATKSQQHTRVSFNNQIKRIAEQEKAKADRQAFRRAKLDAAIASGDTEEIEYLRFMYSM